MRTALILARRFLTLAGLMVWQGGFLFYTAFVVPIGTEFLGTATSQGFITRQVTNQMNRCGAVALAVMVWDLAASRDPRRLRWFLRVALFTLMVAAAVALFDLHQRLESLLDVPNERVLDRQEFRPLHRIYLWVSSAQWGCAVLYLVLTVAAWRCEDGVEKTGMQ
jgi:ABC-type xylose transport system permease subunit